MDLSNVDRPDPRRKPPKPITRSRLENIALHYLQRFTASRAGLKAMLRRRVTKAANVHSLDPQQAEQWITEVLDKLERLELLDDNRFARTKITTLTRRGEPPRRIRQRLTAWGVAADIIDTVLAEVLDQDSDPDRTAAITYCRRRRIGPFRSDPDTRDRYRQRDLAALARRGIPATTAYAIVDADPDSLEEDSVIPSARA